MASVDPQDLHEEIIQLTKLIRQAKELEQGEAESKLVKLKELIEQEKLFSDPKMRLLIFTEHKHTLDYSVGKLRD